MKSLKRGQIIMLLIAVGVVSAYLIYNKSTTTSSQYMGQFSGSVVMSADFVDENGNIIKGSSGVPLAFFVGDTRIKEILLTVSWQIYDIQSGMDASTFVFSSDVSMNVDVSSFGDVWSISSAILPFPSIQNTNLNGTEQWRFNMRVSPLDLQTEANKHPNDRTDFTITFILNWKAEMYDTVDAFTETATDTLQIARNVWYVKGFKVKVVSE